MPYPTHNVLSAVTAVVYSCIVGFCHVFSQFYFSFRANISVNFLPNIHYVNSRSFLTHFQHVFTMHSTSILLSLAIDWSISGTCDKDQDVKLLKWRVPLGHQIQWAPQASPSWEVKTHYCEFTRIWRVIWGLLSLTKSDQKWPLELEHLAMWSLLHSWTLTCPPSIHTWLAIEAEMTDYWWQG